MLEFGLDTLQIGGIPNAPQLLADALADRQFWGEMDGILGQVILATLPGDAGEHGLASGAQARMIVGGDEGEPPHAAGHQDCPGRPASGARPR